MPLTAGTRLGPYEVLAKLGEGGMGEVYRARDTRLQRNVAIKVLPAGIAADDERRRRFDQEARTIAALSRPTVDRVSPDVRYVYAQWYLMPLARFDEAFQQIETALIDDPLNLFLRISVGMIEICRGNEDRGVAALRQVLELNDRMYVPNLWLCGVALKQSRLGEAVTLAERAHAIEPRSLLAVGTLAGALARSGDHERAERLRHELGTGDAIGAAAGFVGYHLVRGDTDGAASWFVRAIAQHDLRASWILRRLFGDVLTSSGHWPALAKVMNLPAS